MACRPGYLFRHGKHGLGYYRADKLVELDARHHEHAEGISRAGNKPAGAAKPPQHDQPPACSCPPTPSAPAALGEQIGHKPERSMSPLIPRSEQGMASAPSRRHLKGAEGSGHEASAGESQGNSIAAVTSSGSETRHAAAAPTPAPGTLQGAAQEVPCVKNASDSTCQDQSSPPGSTNPSLPHMQAQANAATAQPDVSSLSAGATEPPTRYPAHVVQLLGEGGQHAGERAPDMYCCCLCPQQGLLLAGSVGHTDHTFTVWSLETGQLLQQLQGHTAPVLCLAMSKDASLILSGSYDKTIR